MSRSPVRMTAEVGDGQALAHRVGDEHLANMPGLNCPSWLGSSTRTCTVRDRLLDHRVDEDDLACELLAGSAGNVTVTGMPTSTCGSSYS